MRNLLGRRFAIDTNIVGNRTPAVSSLWRYHDTGWIQLVKTDTLDTELAGTSDPAKRDRLLREVAPLVEQLGPLVLDHSRLNFSVTGSDADQASLNEVIQVLYGEDDPRRPGAARSRQRIRDAMHVNTAKRYGLDGLVTLDKKDLLDREPAIREAFGGGFQIYDPERALAFVERLRARYEVRQAGYVRSKRAADD